MQRRNTSFAPDQPEPKFSSTQLGFVLLFILHSQANCSTIPAHCFTDASRTFGEVSPEILKGLAAQESGGRCLQRHPVNANGSYDIGCMGINSSWLPTLHNRFGITEQDLYDACTNVHVGAWLYAKNVRRFGNSWRAVGAYNASSEHKRIRYAWKIYNRLAATR